MDSVKMSIRKPSIWFTMGVLTVSFAQLITIDENIQPPHYIKSMESAETFQRDESQLGQNSDQFIAPDDINSTDSDVNDTNNENSSDNYNQNSESNETEQYSSENHEIDSNKSEKSDENQSSNINDDHSMGNNSFEIGSPEQTIENVDADNSTEVISNSEEQNVDLIIMTKYGAVRGYELHGTTGIQSYIDIPYGKYINPFQAPIPPDPWEDIREITKHEKLCPQEQQPDNNPDCLTLTVFTPKNASNASVLFHIHDGNFMSGSGDPSIYGPKYLVPKGIILVLPNYRLGPLGFLCLQNETVPGNAALKDLTLALNWTNSNIVQFGGNPSNIVVSGEGTSGALAGYLALSPQSKNYISKVITESGSVLSHWAFDRNPIDIGTDLINKIRESINHTEIFQDVPHIVTAAKNITLKPCIDYGPEAFISESPWKMLHAPRSIPFMMGAANQAGMHLALEITDSNLSELNNNLSLLLPQDLEFDTDENRFMVAGEVKKQYFGEEKITLDHIKEISMWNTDASYLSPGIRHARLLVNAGAKVHFYEFAFDKYAHQGNNSVQGAARGDIAKYVFSQSEDIPDAETEISKIINMMTDLWVTFIETGIPTAEGIEWRELKDVDEREEQWLLVDSASESKSGLHIDRLKLWTQIYYKYYIERNIGRQLHSCFYSIVILVLIVFNICTKTAM